MPGVGVWGFNPQTKFERDKDRDKAKKEAGLKKHRQTCEKNRSKRKKK